MLRRRIVLLFILALILLGVESVQSRYSPPASSVGQLASGAVPDSAATAAGSSSGDKAKTDISGGNSLCPSPDSAKNEVYRKPDSKGTPPIPPYPGTFTEGGKTYKNLYGKPCTSIQLVGQTKSAVDKASCVAPNVCNATGCDANGKTCKKPDVKVASNCGNGQLLQQPVMNDAGKTAPVGCTVPGKGSGSGSGKAPSGSPPGSKTTPTTDGAKTPPATDVGKTNPGNLQPLPPDPTKMSPANPGGAPAAPSGAGDKEIPPSMLSTDRGAVTPDVGRTGGEPQSGGVQGAPSGGGAAQAPAGPALTGQQGGLTPPAGPAPAGPVGGGPVPAPAAGPAPIASVAPAPQSTFGSPYSGSGGGGVGGGSGGSGGSGGGASRFGGGRSGGAAEGGGTGGGASGGTGGGRTGGGAFGSQATRGGFGGGFSSFASSFGSSAASFASSIASFVSTAVSLASNSQSESSSNAYAQQVFASPFVQQRGASRVSGSQQPFTTGAAQVGGQQAGDTTGQNPYYVPQNGASSLDTLARPTPSLRPIDWPASEGDPSLFTGTPDQQQPIGSSGVTLPADDKTAQTGGQPRKRLVLPASSLFGSTTAASTRPAQEAAAVPQGSAGAFDGGAHDASSTSSDAAFAAQDESSRGAFGDALKTVTDNLFVKGIASAARNLWQFFFQHTACQVEGGCDDSQGDVLGRASLLVRGDRFAGALMPDGGDLPKAEIVTQLTVPPAPPAPSLLERAAGTLVSLGEGLRSIQSAVFGMNGLPQSAQPVGRIENPVSTTQPIVQKDTGAGSAGVPAPAEQPARTGVAQQGSVPHTGTSTAIASSTPPAAATSTSAIQASTTAAKASSTPEFQAVPGPAAQQQTGWLTETVRRPVSWLVGAVQQMGNWISSLFAR